MHTYTHNRFVSPTCPQPHHPRRRVSVVRVARPQPSVAVEAPAVDAAARQQRTRVVASGGEGDEACGEARRKLGVCVSACREGRDVCMSACLLYMYVWRYVFMYVIMYVCRYYFHLPLIGSVPKRLSLYLHSDCALLTPQTGT